MKDGSLNQTQRLFALAILIAIAGLSISATTGQWTWFSRSGSLVVVVGIILTGEQYLASHSKFNAFMTKVGATTAEIENECESPLYESPTSRWLGEMFGFYLLIAGTVIWGFGDLVGLLPLFK